MIGLGFVYAVAGSLFLLVAIDGIARGAGWRGRGRAAFWGLLATSMFLGDWLGDLGNGVLVLALVILAGAGVFARGLTVPSVEASMSPERSAVLFAVALVIPATAAIGTLAAVLHPDLLPPKNATLIAFAAGAILALAIGAAALRASPRLALRQGAILLDQIGWAAVLPQMLASLGAVFTLAGVGRLVGELLAETPLTHTLLGAVVTFTLGMALFTIVMGNAFAAFPIMFAAVALPVLIHQHGGNPAAIAALGMLTGFCGTLLTPMAANFNIVPAALLELRDRYGVIREQVGTAIPLLVFNTLLIWLAAFG